MVLHLEWYIDSIYNISTKCCILLFNIYIFSIDFEKRLPKDKLMMMCKLEAVQKYVRRSDYQFYQALVEVLIPDVLRPIPSKF